AAGTNGPTPQASCACFATAVDKVCIMTTILVATESTVIAIDAERGTLTPSAGVGERPTCLAADPLVRGRAWCGTQRGGVYRSDDGGASWRAVGLEGKRITSIAASPAQSDLVWVGTEPSEIWYSANGGEAWESAYPLETLPSSTARAFPPATDTDPR